MNKTIRNLAIAALFIFPGLSGFPQEVQQDEAPAAKPVVEENVSFPILIGIPRSNLVVIDGETEGLIYYILYLDEMAITAFCEK